MVKSLVDLDAEALIDASEHLGTSGWGDTVNAALREIAVIHRRREALAQLTALARTGQFDELLEKKRRP